MNPATLIGGLILIIVVFLAVRYIYREKKKGTKCIGCPFAEGCAKYDPGSSCTCNENSGCCH